MEKLQLKKILTLSIFLLLFSCNGKGTEEDSTQEQDIIENESDDTSTEGDEYEAEVQDGDSIEWEEFTITTIDPNHGPFVGGTVVLIRGRGFEEGASVYFGEHLVQPADTVVLDDNRIQVITPAGSPGSVDVKVVIDDREAIKQNGFKYDIFYVDPPSGSISGGTYVKIIGSGTEFDENSAVTFDGADATQIEYVSPLMITCKTPPGFVGPANVKIDGDIHDYEVSEAYNYFNHADPINGGLGGGPIEGAVNVTVLNAATADPVPEAFCILGISGETEYKGLTDSRGQITFSGPELRGVQSITASKEGFESTTITDFDARDVTIFLVPIPDPQPGPLPPPMLGAIVKGELVFEHGGEFGPGPWEAIPDPGPDEVKMAYVYGTGEDIFYPPPSPSGGGAQPIVTEDMENTGEHGFLYSVFVRPGTIAVYALAGLQNTVTGLFVPYIFGVTRGIITGPGEEVDGVLIYVIHPLDQPFTARMEEYYPPLDFSYGPKVYKSDLFLDLAGDGVIFRKDATIIQNTPSDFYYPGWLPLRYELSDASYTLVLGAYTPAVDPLSGQTIYANPFSVKVISKYTRPWETVIVKDFIGIPYAVDPPFGGRIGRMHMEFGNDGAEPDFWLVLLQTYPDQLPLWRILLPGSKLSYDLPDLATIAGLPAPPNGYTIWIVYGISSPGFEYNEFSYRYLYQNYWSAYSADAFIFEF